MVKETQRSWASSLKKHFWHEIHFQMMVSRKDLNLEKIFICFAHKKWKKGKGFHRVVPWIEHGPVLNINCDSRLTWPKGEIQICDCYNLRIEEISEFFNFSPTVLTNKGFDQAFSFTISFTIYFPQSSNCYFVATSDNQS